MDNKFKNFSDNELKDINGGNILVDKVRNKCRAVEYYCNGVVDYFTFNTAKAKYEFRQAHYFWNK